MLVAPARVVASCDSFEVSSSNFAPCICNTDPRYCVPFSDNYTSNLLKILFPSRPVAGDETPYSKAEIEVNRWDMSRNAALSILIAGGSYMLIRQTKPREKSARQS